MPGYKNLATQRFQHDLGCKVLLPHFYSASPESQPKGQGICEGRLIKVLNIIGVNPCEKDWKGGLQAALQ